MRTDTVNELFRTDIYLGVLVLNLGLEVAKRQRRDEGSPRPDEHHEDRRDEHAGGGTGGHASSQHPVLKMHHGRALGGSSWFLSRVFDMMRQAVRKAKMGW